MGTVVTNKVQANSLYLANNAGYTMEIKSSGSMVADLNIQFPASLGNDGSVIKTNGSGAMSWGGFVDNAYGTTNVSQPINIATLDTNITFSTPFVTRPTILASAYSNTNLQSDFGQRFVGEYVKNVTTTGFTFSGKMLTNLDSLVGANGTDYSIKSLADGSFGIAYYDSVATSIKFARSFDANYWTVYNIGLGGILCSLVILKNGCPGVFYTNGTNQIQFAYSHLIDGSGKWSIYNVGSLVGANYTMMSSTLTSNGLPSVAYYDLVNNTLNYSVNTLVDGSGVWLSNTIIIGAGSYPSLSFSSVTKLPIVSYIGNGGNGLYFASNASIDGTGIWTANLVSSNNPVSYTSIITLNSGYPIISYYYNGGLHFARSTNTTGTTWAAAVLVDSSNVGTYSKIFLFSNKTIGIIYYNSASAILKIAINANNLGTGGWTIRSLFSVSQGKTSSVLTYDGHLMIAYYSSGNLRTFKSVLLNDATVANTAYTIKWYAIQ